MAAKRKKSPKYGRTVKNDVKSEMDRMKKGTAKSGKGNHPKVKSRKQAIAIALSKARKEGKKVPKKAKAASKSRAK